MICGQSPVGYGLPERTGFIKKGLSAGYPRVRVACKEPIQAAIVWSSSENPNNSNNARNVNFNNGNVNNDNKNNGNNVRSIFAFFVQPNAQTM